MKKKYVLWLISIVIVVIAAIAIVNSLSKEKASASNEITTDSSNDRRDNSVIDTVSDEDKEVSEGTGPEETPIIVERDGSIDNSINIPKDEITDDTSKINSEATGTVEDSDKSVSLKKSNSEASGEDAGKEDSSYSSGFTSPEEASDRVSDEMLQEGYELPFVPAQ